MTSLLNTFARRLADHAAEIGPCTYAKLTASIATGAGGCEFAREVFNAALTAGLIVRDGTTEDGRMYLFHAV